MQLFFIKQYIYSTSHTATSVISLVRYWYSKISPSNKKWLKRCPSLMNLSPNNSWRISRYTFEYLGTLTGFIGFPPSISNVIETVSNGSQYAVSTILSSTMVSFCLNSIPLSYHPIKWWLTFVGVYKGSLVGTYLWTIIGAISLLPPSVLKVIVTSSFSIK